MGKFRGLFLLRSLLLVALLSVMALPCAQAEQAGNSRKQSKIKERLERFKLERGDVCRAASVKGVKPLLGVFLKLKEIGVDSDHEFNRNNLHNYNCPPSAAYCAATVSTSAYMAAGDDKELTFKPTPLARQIYTGADPAFRTSPKAVAKSALSAAVGDEQPWSGQILVFAKQNGGGHVGVIKSVRNVVNPQNPNEMLLELTTIEANTTLVHDEILEELAAVMDDQEMTKRTQVAEKKRYLRVVENKRNPGFFDLKFLPNPFNERERKKELQDDMEIMGLVEPFRSKSSAHACLEPQGEYDSQAFSENPGANASVAKLSPPEPVAESSAVDAGVVLPAGSAGAAK